MKKFFCFGKDDFCDDTNKCLNCDFCNCSGGEEREAAETNADRIRSMTDEELGGMFARFMSDILEQNGLDDEFKVDSTFADDMVHWLKKPYKED